MCCRRDVGADYTEELKFSLPLQGAGFFSAGVWRLNKIYGGRAVCFVSLS